MLLNRKEREKVFVTNQLFRSEKRWHGRETTQEYKCLVELNMARIAPSGCGLTKMVDSCGGERGNTTEPFACVP